MYVCVCVEQWISLTAEPIWFSFTEKLLICHGEVYNYHLKKISLETLKKKLFLFKIYRLKMEGIPTFALQPLHQVPSRGVAASPIT